MKFSQLNFVDQVKKSKNDQHARWLTLIFLLSTVLASLGLASYAYLQEHGLMLPRSFVKADIDFSNLPVKQNDDFPSQLESWKNKELVSLSGQWAIKVDMLETNQQWSYQENKVMSAASLIKLPVVASFYLQVEEKDYSLTDIYVLKEEDKLGGSGILAGEPEGTELSWRRILQLAFSHSDNTAFNILRQQLGDDLISQNLTDWGMEDTDLGENLTSAKDIGLFFSQLYHGQLVNSTHQQMMINDLTETIYEDQLPAGIPQGIKVAHKVGYEQEVVADAGVVYVPDSPFVLVLISNQVNPSQAKSIFPNLVKEIYWRVIDD